MSPIPKLLTRDAFREGVFARAGHRCVLCSAPADDAHHILERRLWPDGGYYLDNGASVCEPCHLKCEQTVHSVEAVREACGIRRVIVPPHLYADQVYDKWGNPVLANGLRLKGELFFDASVQKVISQAFDLATLFATWVKYPRTHHLPWSEGVNDDDRVLATLEGLQGQRVIVSTKRDGENTTLYRDYLHARSVDGRNHPSRAWVKNFWAQICADIPEGWRICGENLYARHSIAYTELSTYFEGFSLWNEKNECLSWDDTMEWFGLMGVTPVPVIYDGPFDEKAIQALWNPKERETCEGYVVRIAGAIPYGDFRRRIGKFVRAGHVQTSKHWMHGQPVTPNGLKPNEG